MTTANSTSVLFTTDAHNDRYRDASRRLATRSAAIRERLVAELGLAQNLYELGWRSLLTSQREVAERCSTGSAPEVESYWSETAKPAADQLTDRCLHIVDAHLLLLFDAVSVFIDGVRPSLGINGGPPSPGAYESLRSDVERLIEPVSTVALDRKPLNDVGERWHERLRRQAIRRYVRSGGATEAGYAQAIDVLELQMLRQPPWVHADQLMSAFELAHTDVRRCVVDRIDRMLSDLLPT